MKTTNKFTPGKDSDEPTQTFQSIPENQTEESTPVPEEQSENSVEPKTL